MMRTIQSLCAVSLLACSAWAQESASVIDPQRRGPAYEIPFYTGTIMPTPQQAEYSDEFVPLSRVGVILPGAVPADDPRLTLLLERIARRGGSFRIVKGVGGDFDSFVVVGDAASHLCPEDAPDRPESYLIHPMEKDGKPVFVLKGGDKLGLLWAIAAFNQLVTVRGGRPVARWAVVRDFPDTPGKRAYTPMNEDETPAKAWFAVNLLRANVVVYRMVRKMRRGVGLGWGEAELRKWRDRLKGIGGLLNPLGIEWYDSLWPLTTTPETTIHTKSEQDFRLILEVANSLAEAGGNLCLLYDDIRFPMSPADKADFGSAREADVYFLNKLYSAVAAQHPDFRILFCPPFYWGPKSDVSGLYGESRDEYLAAIGKGLPEAVHVYWTGPKVKSSKESPEDMRWMTELIRRKPVFWQNGYGVIHGGVYYHYPTDPIPAWRDWYYEAFFDDLAFFTLNTAGASANMTLMDYMWNRKAYDPERSIAAAGAKLVGPDAYPVLVKACEALEALDRYGWTPNAAAARNVVDVKRKTAELLTRRDEALALRPEVFRTWTPLPYYAKLRELYLKRLLRHPDLKQLTHADELVKERAAKEAGADPNADVILTPTDFELKRPARHYGAGEARRFVVWVNGTRSGLSTMRAAFRLTGPAAAARELVIAGLDHDASAPCRIRILINDKAVFEGPNPFAKDKWTTHAFKAPADCFRAGENSLVITNLEESDNISGAPWFMLNYVVIRRTE